MDKKNIWVLEFLNSLPSWLTDQQIDEEILSFQSKWWEILWLEDFLGAAENEKNLTKPSQETNNDNNASMWLWQSLATAWAVGTLPWIIVWKRLVKDIIWPNEKEIWDAVAWVNKRLVWAWWNMKPEMADKTTKEIIKLMGNIDGWSPWIKDSRWLYNYAQSIKNWAYDAKEQVKIDNANKTITIKALDPLKSEISKLEKAWASSSKIDALKKQLKEIESKFNKSWEMSLSDAEEIKKYHAWESNIYKNAKKMWNVAESNSVWVWSTKIADWFRAEIKSAAPEIEPYNKVYGASKDIESWLAKMSNTVSKQNVSTPLRIAQTKWAKIVQSIPWVATAWKILSPLEEATYAERKIPQLIKMFKKYWDRVIKYIDKNATKWKLLNAGNITKAWASTLKALSSIEWTLPPWVLWTQKVIPASFPNNKINTEFEESPSALWEFTKSMKNTVKPLTDKQKKELAKWVKIWQATTAVWWVAPTQNNPINIQKNKIENIDKVWWPKFWIQTWF